MARSAHDLLYVDFDGQRTDPETLMDEGFVDARHLQRVPDLAALVDDPRADPVDRLTACLMLAEWGEPSGYRAVGAVARAPRRPAWFGCRISEFHGVDSTFGELARRVVVSMISADDKGTQLERVACLRELVGIADRECFDDQLGFGVVYGPPEDLLDDVVAAVHRGLPRLDDETALEFDLASQLVDIAAPLTRVDEEKAISLISDVLARTTLALPVRYAFEVVAAGAKPISWEFGRYLLSLGDGRDQDRFEWAIGLRRRRMGQ